MRQISFKNQLITLRTVNYTAAIDSGNTNPRTALTARTARSGMT